MSKKKNSLMVAEQVFEIRHRPVGSFIDCRGYVADSIRSTFLPHWKIDDNVVTFRDKPDTTEKEGAFAGYRNAGYFAFDPPTANFFCDRGTAFWKTLLKNGHYEVPEAERLGVRTKIFFPLDRTFEDIKKAVLENVYSDKSNTLFGATPKDVQFIFDLEDADFSVRVAGGPIHVKEAGRYFGFKSEHFSNAGFFLDVDYSQEKVISHNDVPRLLKSAVTMSWSKIENIAASMGI